MQQPPLFGEPAVQLAECTAGGDGFYKNGSSVHAAVLAVQHKACGQQEQAAEGSAHHRQPVCTGLGQNGGQRSGFRLCILRHVLCAAGTTAASAVVSAAGVSAGAVPSCAGASGVTAGSAGVTVPGWTGRPAVLGVSGLVAGVSGSLGSGVSLGSTTCLVCPHLSMEQM